MRHDEKVVLGKVRREYVAKLVANGEGRRRARREARKWVRASLEGNT